MVISVSFMVIALLLAGVERKAGRTIGELLGFAVIYIFTYMNI